MSCSSSPDGIESGSAGSIQIILNGGYHPHPLDMGGVAVAIGDAELALAGGADSAEAAARIVGKLLRHFPGVAGGFLDHGGLEGIEVGKQVLGLCLEIGRAHV